MVPTRYIFIIKLYIFVLVILFRHCGNYLSGTGNAQIRKNGVPQSSVANKPLFASNKRQNLDPDPHDTDGDLQRGINRNKNI
jgi:hypothetical protein